MKIVASKDFGHNKAPLLPLEIEKEVTAKKEDLTSVYLQTEPGNTDAPTVKVTFPILDGSKESPREIIVWRATMAKCIIGLNADNGLKMDRLIKQFCKGLALSTYKSALAHQIAVVKAGDIAVARSRVPADDTHVDHAARTAELATAENKSANTYLQEPRGSQWVQEAANAILTQLLPHKILQRVKRYLRREARKPADMKVKTYYMNIQRINDEEIPRLPPNFNEAQKIQPDELIDILLFGTPKSWQREMDRQGFDPLTHTTQQVIDFMERIEMTEDFDGDKKVQHVTKKGNNNNNNKRKNDTSSDADGSKYCMMHGKNNTHDTSDCKSLKAQVKKLKGNESNNFQKKGKNKNKTWKKKSDNDSTDPKKELAALTKQVKDLTKQLEVNAIEPVKKRQVKWPIEEEDTAKDEMDLAALDAELKEFNYGDLDKMDIKDDATSEKEDGEMDSIEDEVSV